MIDGHDGYQPTPPQGPHPLAYAAQAVRLREVSSELESLKEQLIVAETDRAKLVRKLKTLIASFDSGQFDVEPDLFQAEVIGAEDLLKELGEVAP
jgi:hypothetical protein